MLLTLLVLHVLTAFADSQPLAREPISPLPMQVEVTDTAKVELGRLLFHEKSLSKDNTVSCASCHDLARGGVDHLPSSRGVGGAKGLINAPTIFNSTFNISQFWNGRAKTLENQVSEPILAQNEMASTWVDVIKKLRADAPYLKMFQSIYKDGVTRKNVVDSIVHFEKTLTTPNSRFDRYLRGETMALTKIEKNGYLKFKTFGCIACHQGMNVGGNMYQTMGIMGNYFLDRGTPIEAADLGRYQVTGLEADKHVFRVPSLRNVALTAPYFHDGSAETLSEAVKVMGKYQLGRTIDAADIEALVAFLLTLSGDISAGATPPVKAGGQ